MQRYSFFGSIQLKSNEFAILTSIYFLQTQNVPLHYFEESMNLFLRTINARVDVQKITMSAQRLDISHSKCKVLSVINWE
jgi:hypothetical protein